jgi:Pyruvate/2-oxoacid:ferredoxin oxidoreductase delta subunit
MLILLIVVGLLVLASLAFFLIVGEEGHFHRSTWKFFRESGVRLRTLHGYIYMRWTQKYINALIGMTGSGQTSSKGEHWLAQRYHAKVLTHEHACSIVNLDKPIKRRSLDQIVPYPIARDILLQASPDIVVYECVCRNKQEKHCEPTQVCMIVGRPFTDLVLEHHPGQARRLDRAGALELLEAEHLRGHVHTAWFKDAMMGRFYAICNCCKCCCGGIHEMAVRGVPMITSSGYVAQIDAALCAQCGDCVEACPFRAIRQTDDAVLHDWARCFGCGVCEVKCATGAITMVRDERKGVPLDVRTMA